jgi:hypothetical protein
MGRSAEKTLRLLREVADRREPCTEAKNHFLRTEFSYHAFARATMSADRYLEIIEESLAVNEKLAVYEKVVDDESAARELRVLLARRANWLRISARLRATEKSASGLKQEESGDSEPTHLMDAAEAEALLFSPIRMAGNLRERANEACQKIVKTSKQPGGHYGLPQRELARRRPKNKRFAWKTSATRPL